jgi:hypothetical protein
MDLAFLFFVFVCAVDLRFPPYLVLFGSGFSFFVIVFLVIVFSFSFVVLKKTSSSKFFANVSVLQSCEHEREKVEYSEKTKS